MSNAEPSQRMRPRTEKAGPRGPALVISYRLPATGYQLDNVLVRDFLDGLLLLLPAEPLNLQRRLLLEHLLTVQPLHLLVLAQLLGGHVRFLAGLQLLLTRVLGDAEIVEVCLHAL